MLPETFVRVGNNNISADAVLEAGLDREFRAAWSIDGQGGITLDLVKRAKVAKDLAQAAVEAHVEATAKGRGYASAVSCAGYVTSTAPAWATEAATFIAWRDAVWMHTFAQLALVESGDRDEPTAAALIAELPAINWPA